MPSTLIDIASRLQAVIDTALDGIIIIDSDGVIEEINQSALNLFEYTKSEVMGNNVHMLMPSPDRERHSGYIDNYITTRIPKIIGIGREVMGLKKNGSEFPFRLAVSEVVLNDRVIFTGIIHDLSKIKTAEAAQQKLTEELEHRVIERTNELEQVVNRLLQTNQQLGNEIKERQYAEEKLIEKETQLRISLKKEKELNELKSRFLSMASHEFRTPLSTILSSVSLISRYQTTEEADKRIKHVERIKSSVNNLTGILNDFLSLGKLEEGKVTLKIEYLDVKSLVHSIIDDMEGILRPNQLIHVHTFGKPYRLKSDGRIIKNILFNILSNAIKYSTKGQSVNCHISYASDGVSIEVIDQGIGISEADQKHLFDRFFRASNVDTIQGTGLGLNIVQKYLELIQGHISFTSQLHEGSTFIITIPNYIES
jgi:PAS domain S-box-containing protein